MNKFNVGDRVLTKEGQPFQEHFGPGTVEVQPTKKSPYYEVSLDGFASDPITGLQWLFSESELELLPHTGGGVGPGAPGGDVRSLLAARYETNNDKGEAV